MIKKLINLVSIYVVFFTNGYAVSNVKNILNSSDYQNDTIKAPDIWNVPDIDGEADDICWDSVAWHQMDQVWVPIDEDIDSTDFYGRFKIIWSSKTNLLYIIAEITDDIRVDGYVYDEKDNTYPSYDCIELFFDEDHSGHEHVFDYIKSDGTTPGLYNSENAFSYHLDAVSPPDGQVVHDFYACDIDGKNWWPDGAITMNYASHFPGFALKKNGNVYTYEMSLMVYDTTYDKNIDSSRVQLHEGKISGFTLAFCDDDTPGNPVRQTFIGSTPANRNHLNKDGNYDYMWENADDYGILELVSKTSQTVSDKSIKLDSSGKNELLIYPNPSSDRLNMDLSNNFTGSVHFTILNIQGVELLNETLNKPSTKLIVPLNIQQYPEGTYFLKVNYGNSELITKFMKLEP